MSEIKHKITINADQATIYAALATAQGLKSWFTSHVEGTGEPGTNWKLSFTNQPFFSWQILTADNPTRVDWKCLEGPGNAAGTEVAFTVAAESNNSSTLTIAHRGWEANDPKFDKCVEIWRELMDRLQKYCESGVATPVYH